MCLNEWNFIPPGWSATKNKLSIKILSDSETNRKENKGNLMIFRKIKFEKYDRSLAEKPGKIVTCDKWMTSTIGLCYG